MCKDAMYIFLACAEGFVAQYGPSRTATWVKKCARWGCNALAAGSAGDNFSDVFAAKAVHQWLWAWLLAAKQREIDCCTENEPPTLIGECFRPLGDVFSWPLGAPAVQFCWRLERTLFLPEHRHTSQSFCTFFPHQFECLLLFEERFHLFAPNCEGDCDVA